MSDGTDPFLDAYRATAARIQAMARAAPGELARPVPACPGWTAHQTLAHVTALCLDWVDGNLEDYGTESWTAAQLARFGSRTADELIDLWTDALDRFGDIADSPLGGTPAMWAFGDAVVHEADLRPVLAPGTHVPADGVALGLKAAISRWRQQLTAAGTPPLVIATPEGREWAVGDVDDDTTRVTAPSHELFRALFGRRSRPQVEAWDWSGEAAVYLDAGLPVPFRWAEEAVID